ncbi:hypothetical protein [Salicibibacter kimchii]|uniref:Uncharacterized protein n=1 Tax=Salicibibacter kimchii TaxID=2099786 RepID=A0A345BUI1_9BACI|nr:hypothetical protein [Salicibibacter kimchii]AXF54612.1 hypothetical protein DT065_00335 [Salicibibacter kimchii]
MEAKEGYAQGRLQSFLEKSIREKLVECMSDFNDYAGAQGDILLEMGIKEEDAKIIFEEAYKRAIEKGMEQISSKK